MTFIMHGIQFLILRTVNFRSPLNCVHLSKIYGMLLFMDSIFDVNILLEKLAAVSVCV